MTPHDTIILRLQFPKKKWYGKTELKYRAIGFEFTNRLSFILHNLLGIKDGKQLNELTEKNGSQWLVNQSLFCAAKAFCETHRLDENFDFNSLMQALALSSPEDQEKLMTCWKNSREFGATIKKKMAAKRKKK